MATQQVLGSEIVELRGANRTFNIPSCSLSPDDLRRLFSLLEQKALEAANKQVTSLQQNPGQTLQQFEQVCEQTRKKLKLVVRIHSKNGDWSGGTSSELLADSSLPSSIISVEFDSCALFRNEVKFNPLNWFSVTLNFSHTSVFDMNNQPQVINSTATLNGTDITWANGVFNELTRFFAERKSLRGWLYAERTYDFLVVLLGFPLSFAVFYQLSKWLKTLATLPSGLSTAIYIYLVLVTLYCFRLTFNYAKWVFPRMELTAPRQSAAVRHKVALIFIGLTMARILVKAVWDLIIRRP